MKYEENNIDLIIANGEKAKNARGINKELFERIINAGVDVVTMGNYTFSDKEIYDINDNRLLIPANINKES